MKKVLTLITFCVVASSFGILIAAAYSSKDQKWVSSYTVFYVLGLLAFWGWLALENKENKV